MLPKEPIYMIYYFVFIELCRDIFQQRSKGPAEHLCAGLINPDVYMSVVYPAYKLYSEGTAEMVFHSLNRRHPRLLALEALRRMTGSRPRLLKTAGSRAGPCSRAGPYPRLLSSASQEYLGFGNSHVLLVAGQIQKLKIVHD